MVCGSTHEFTGDIQREPQNDGLSASLEDVLITRIIKMYLICELSLNNRVFLVVSFLYEMCFVVFELNFKRHLPYLCM